MSRPMTPPPSELTTAGEKIARDWDPSSWYSGTRASRELATFIDSALASQETRHVAQLEAVLMGEPWEGRYVHLLLCNGGYQKPGTPGLICNCPIYQRILTSERALRESDARHRQEMEEAKREKDDACAVARQIQGEKLAAEQREREAGEALEEIAKIRCGIPGHSVAVGCHAAGFARAALAAIRPAPSPVSAPPTETEEESLVRIKVALGLRPTATLAEIAIHAEFAANDIERLHAEKMRLLYPASPVEPGQEPETR